MLDACLFFHLCPRHRLLLRRPGEFDTKPIERFAFLQRSGLEATHELLPQGLELVHQSVALSNDRLLCQRMLRLEQMLLGLRPIFLPEREYFSELR